MKKMKFIKAMSKVKDNNLTKEPVVTTNEIIKPNKKKRKIKVRRKK